MSPTVHDFFEISPSAFASLRLPVRGPKQALNVRLGTSNNRARTSNDREGARLLHSWRLPKDPVYCHQVRVTVEALKLHQAASGACGRIIFWRVRSQKPLALYLHSFVSALLSVERVKGIEPS